MLSFPKLVYGNKFALQPLPPPGTFKGQKVLVTGASGGIGLAAAVHFINLGASSVIITARSAAKGAAAKASIEAQINTKGKDVVKAMVLDMSTLAGTKAFADKVRDEVKEIDIVILNAGVFNMAFRLAAGGYEETIQVNVLSTALLGLLLLPWMKEAGKGKAHLGVVTSGVNKDVAIGGKWPQKDILAFFSKEENRPPGFNGMYGTSKLLEQYVVNELAKLAVGKDGSPQVIVNAICPGMVKSDLGREAKTNAVKAAVIDGFMTAVMKSTKGGARMLVRSAVTRPEENGKHISDVPEEEWTQSVQHNILGPEGQKMQAVVWKEVVTVLAQQAPEVKQIAHMETA